MRYARVVTDVAAEVVRVEPFTIFAPDYAQLFEPVPADVQEGWLRTAGVWAPDPARVRESAKENRAAAVAAIKVTTQAGNIFDGDEVSQDRMARAILGLQAAGVPTVTWVLADNTVIAATAAELGEALALAGAAQAAVWVLP